MKKSERHVTAVNVTRNFARGNRRRFRLGLLTGTAMLAFVSAGAVPAHANGIPQQTEQPQVLAQSNRTFTLDLPARPLAQALVAFSNATGIDIVFDGQVPTDRPGPAIKGEMTAAEALNRLLSGTGIVWTFSDDKTVALSRPAASDNRITLGTVAVEGRTLSSQAGIGAPPPEYAGGQVARGGRLGVLGNLDMMDTPFNQTNYTSKLLQDQQSQRISDALKNDPTANPVWSPATGLDGFTIRGFNVSNTSILFDGLPGAGPTTFSSMASESVERVEVLKGPSALVNGMSPASTAGGSVNLIPKRAKDEPITQITPNYTIDGQVGGHVDIGRRYGADQEFGIRFNGVYRNGDTPIDFLSIESRLAALALDYAGSRFRASADMGYDHQDLQGTRRVFSVTGGLNAPSAPENSSNPFGEHEFKDADFYYGVGNFEYDVAETFTAYAKMAANLQRYTTYISNRTIGNGDGDLNAGNGTAMVSQTRRVFGEGGLRADLDGGPIRHRITAAFSWRESTGWSRSFSNAFSASNLYDPTYDPAPAVSALGDPEDAPMSSESSTTALTLADTASFLDDRVHLLFGISRQEVSNKGYSQTTGAVTSSYRDFAMTPMLGLTVKPREDISLYANYAEGLQPGSTAPNTAANAGEVFPPYVSKQFEVGGKWDMGRLAATVALFQITQPSAFTNPDTNVYGVDGEQRNRGIDVNVFGEVAEGIRVLGGVAFIDSEQTKTSGGVNEGNTGIGTPKVRAVLGGEWDLPFVKGLTLTGRFTYTGSTYLNAANTSEAPDWMQLDVGARYAIERQGGKPILIRANIDNLLDANYWNTNATGSLVLSDPLTFKLSASYDF